MNRDEFKKSETSSCNVCGAAVEIGSATSRCSDRNCLTRDRDNNLSTSSEPVEIIEYWKGRAKSAEGELDTALTRDELRQEALDAFGDYMTADSRVDAEEAEIRCDTYVEHLDVGWGWIKEAYE